MSRLNLATAIALSIAGTASTVNAIELTDFLDPTSTYEQAFVDGRFSSKTGNQERTSYDLRLQGDYDYNFNSLPRNWRLLFDGQANMSRGPNKADPDQENYLANLRGNIDNYFQNREPLFWYAAGESSYRDDADDVFVKVGGGLGYGRVIDATPLAYVLRFEEELREHGVIAGPISDATYLELARIVARRAEYRGRYGAEEYQAQWISDMEKVLATAGVLKSGALGAAGVVHMNRVLDEERISVRKHGWVVRGGPSVVVQDFNGESGDPAIDLEFEYARPFGYRSQFINTASFSTIWGDDTDQLWRNRMTYTYEVSDRIDWENRWNFDHLNAGGGGKDITTNALSTTLRYYLTNRIAAGATVSVIKIDDDIKGNGNDETDLQTFFDVRYRLK
ncbi:MAG: DUF481 domain-containing protein [Thiotrichales bacterium]